MVGRIYLTSRRIPLWPVVREIDPTPRRIPKGLKSWVDRIIDLVRGGKVKSTLIPHKAKLTGRPSR